MPKAQFTIPRFNDKTFCIQKREKYAEALRKSKKKIIIDSQRQSRFQYFKQQIEKNNRLTDYNWYSQETLKGLVRNLGEF
jgi:hypothetical protein